MYKAVLNYHGFERIVEIPYFMTSIYVDLLPEPKFSCEEMVDLTPSNIIKRGGFTQVEMLDVKKIEFVFDRQKGETLYYTYVR